jgi:lipopolysaccharide/colanic/teichoic acid biosynthesis glycosyltransferase
MNVAKRLFDIVASGLAIILLSPLLIPVIIGLLLTGEHQVFYRQERIGLHGKPFAILKFATMLKASATMNGGDITVRGDPRILPFGGFLRKTKINELPQLFNVMAGDMSLIGYRPLTPRVAALFPTDYWAKVSHLRPGLSGIGSIVFRDEERILDAATDRQKVYADIIAPHKAALELWYADHAGFGTDMKLIALTLLSIIAPDTDARQWLEDLPPAPVSA